MKRLILILLLSSSTAIFAQRFDSDSLNDYSFGQLELFFIGSKISSTETCKEIGTKRAQHDLQQGNKQLLVPVSMVPHPCLTCSYQQIGFREVPFGPSDIHYETLETFREAYNAEMRNMITEEQQELLRMSAKLKPFSFSSTISGSFKFNIKQEKTTFKLQFSSDSLERIFQGQLQNVRIEIKDGSTVTECSYDDIKAIGTPISIMGRKQFSITLTFDFRDIVAMEKLCWCSNVNQRYSFILPLVVN